jgi:hypothetical protein
MGGAIFFFGEYANTMNHKRVAQLVAMLGSSNENEAAVALRKLRDELGSSGFNDVAATIRSGARKKSREELMEAFAEMWEVTYPHDVWYKSCNGSKKGMQHDDPELGYESIIAVLPWSEIVRQKVCLRRYRRVSPDRKLEEYQETIPISYGRWLTDHLQHVEAEAARYAALSPGRKKRWPEFICDCVDCRKYRPKRPRAAQRRELQMG